MFPSRFVPSENGTIYRVFEHVKNAYAKCSTVFPVACGLAAKKCKISPYQIGISVISPSTCFLFITFMECSFTRKKQTSHTRNGAQKKTEWMTLFNSGASSSRVCLNLWASLRLIYTHRQSSPSAGSGFGRTYCTARSQDWASQFSIVKFNTLNNTGREVDLGHDRSRERNMNFWYGLKEKRHDFCFFLHFSSKYYNLLFMSNRSFIFDVIWLMHYKKTCSVLSKKSARYAKKVKSGKLAEGDFEVEGKNVDEISGR